MVYQVAGYPIPRHGPWIRQEVSEPVRGWRTGRAREGRESGEVRVVPANCDNFANVVVTEFGSGGRDGLASGC
jgi:hypothetical protein